MTEHEELTFDLENYIDTHGIVAALDCFAGACGNLAIDAGDKSKALVFQSVRDDIEQIQRSVIAKSK